MMANVLAHRTRPMNSFAAAMGDMARRRCGLLPKLLWTLVSLIIIIIIIIIIIKNVLI